VQHRCVSIFLDRKANAANPPPVGFALGSIEGRVAIHYVNPSNPKDNFTFKCHRSNGTTSSAQDIYAVIAFYCILMCESPKLTIAVLALSSVATQNVMVCDSEIYANLLSCYDCICGLLLSIN